MTVLEINVTAEHIANGFGRNCFACPIALAVGEVTGQLGPGRLMVDPHDILISDGGPWRKVELPLSARQFIQDFDEGKSVQPFRFSVELEEQ